MGNQAQQNPMWLVAKASINLKNFPFADISATEQTNVCQGMKTKEAIRRGRNDVFHLYLCLDKKGQDEFHI